MRATVAFGYCSLKFVCWYSAFLPRDLKNLVIGLCSWRICIISSTKTPVFNFSGVKPLGVQTVLPATRTSLARLSAYLRLRFPMLEKEVFSCAPILQFSFEEEPCLAAGAEGKCSTFPCVVNFFTALIGDQN